MEMRIAPDRQRMFSLLFLTLPVLGSSVPLIQDREQVGIVGDQETSKDEWPWQVSLRRDIGPYWMHFCGGSLIHPQWVLTAAHCIDTIPKEPSTIKIELMEQHLYYKDKLLPLAEIIVPPKYTFAFRGWDIALLKLKTPVELSSHVKLISLPNATETFPLDSECWVTGWGKLDSGVFLPPPYTLRKVQVSLLDPKDCDEKYHKKTYTGSSVKIITDDMLCAGKPHVGFCQGDSGGPLACKVGDSWKQAGVVSWGICGSPIKPGVYTRVSSHVDWINEHVFCNSSTNPIRF
ncbi:tryptase beta-2-like [Gracilinanus agilis]|uniref:tryptase beta-2-like n=1 Tax=Gracilinanus agilis TaxID=191870 RepID=UPI001CFE278A|nr:tryptase beta-2-like [Gracilinanus agilis]